MIDEKNILKNINLFNAATEVSTQEIIWRTEVRKLRAFLKLEYQKDPKGMINLFWRLNENWLAIPEDERWHSSDQRDADHIYEVIINSSNHMDKMSIEFACQLMIHSNDLYKEDTAEFLGMAKDLNAVPYLIKALDSRDYAVVKKSAYALAKIGNVRAEAPLIEIIDRYDIDWVYSENEDKDEFFDGRADYECAIIRHNLFIALWLLNTSKAREKVLKATLGDRDLNIQMGALRFLIREATDLALVYLEQLIDSPVEEVATFAKENLEKLS